MAYEFENNLRAKLRGLTKKRRSGNGDKVFSNLTLFFAAVLLALLVALVIVLIIDSMPAIKQFGIAFVGSSIWDPVKDIYGALPVIYGTLVSSLIALIIAVPVSIGAAIFLVELSPKWLSGPASFLIEMLAAIPSVIIGLWGIWVLVPLMQSSLSPSGQGFITAGIILAIMIIPIITAISREAIKAVPQNQREAMLALGATRWEMIWNCVLPFCRSGLVGASILGLGRALGETMAVTMVIGNSFNITANLLATGTTIASKIASSFGEASGLELSSLIELALILFIITLLVNVIARLLVWRFSSVKAARE